MESGSLSNVRPSPRLVITFIEINDGAFRGVAYTQCVRAQCDNCVRKWVNHVRHRFNDAGGKRIQEEYFLATRQVFDILPF